MAAKDSFRTLKAPSSSIAKPSARLRTDAFIPRRRSPWGLGGKLAQAERRNKYI